MLCGDKLIIRAEYMIDDNIYHLRRFEGEKILFDSPHNRKVPDAVHRVHNWDEVLSFFRAQGVLPSSLEFIRQQPGPCPRHCDPVMKNTGCPSHLVCRKGICVQP